ncbi:S1 family peptidase [Sinorhizobium meliloti]
MEFTGSSSGTAFLYERPDLLLTNLHVLRGFLKEYWKNADGQQLEDIPIPLFLESAGKVAFHTIEGFALLSVSEEARTAVINDRLQGRPDLDIAHIRLSRGIGTPLLHATDLKEENVIVVGYPESSHALVLHKGVQVPGREHGFTPEEWKFLGLATYKGMEGLSGSPVMNSRNEVLGIHTGAFEGIFGDSNTSYFRLLTKGTIE